MKIVDELKYVGNEGELLRPIGVEPPTRPPPETRGIKWRVGGRRVWLKFGCWVLAFPTPARDGVAVVFPFGEVESGYGAPDNAAIFNADGSLRFRLKSPSLLARYVPGYNMPEKYIRPWGFSQIGCKVGKRGFDGRWWMWAYITIADTDCYETRYFDPDTGEFDQEHYSVSRW